MIEGQPRQNLIGAFFFFFFSDAYLELPKSKLSVVGRQG